MRYAIVKGNLFTTYTGTTTCIGIDVHATCKTKVEARAIIKKLYENETDLILVIDLKTGKRAVNV